MSLDSTHECKDGRTLCFECFRAGRERQRVAQLAQAGRDTTAAQADEEPGPGPDDRAHGLAAASSRPLEPAPLSARQIAHRRAMLASLQARRTAAEK